MDNGIPVACGKNRKKSHTICRPHARARSPTRLLTISGTLKPLKRTSSRTHLSVTSDKISHGIESVRTLLPLPRLYITLRTPS